MKKLLFIIPFIINALCIAPIYALCAPGDPGCTRPTGGKPVGKCNRPDDKAGTVCTDRVNGATFAECRPNNKAGTLSCTSLCCAPGYYLKHSDKRVSYGYCVTERDAIKDCERCKEGNCEPTLLKNQDTTYQKLGRGPKIPCNQNLFMGCHPKETPANPEPEDLQNNDEPTGCTLGFSKGSPQTINNVEFANSKKENPTNPTSYHDSNSGIIRQNYHYNNNTLPVEPNLPTLFDLTEVDGNPISPDKLSEIKTAIQIRFDCHDHKYTLDITQPSPNNDAEEPVPPETDNTTQNPPTEETGCTLYFGDNVKISGVKNAESARKSFQKKYKIITTNENGPDIATYYKNDQDTIFKQNYDTGNGANSNYDQAIPHLFNITKIEKNGKLANIDLTGLSSATYAKFECDTPSITHFDTVDPPAQTPPPPSKPRIISSGTTCTQSGCFNPSVFVYMDMMIDTYFDTKASVWKNDEGTFNTKRLIADSAASVVLGTIGGAVTSNIVKKNQIQQGFETLKCTIGGQDVASFGDEFRVGIQ